MLTIGSRKTQQDRDLMIWYSTWMRRALQKLVRKPGVVIKVFLDYNPERQDYDLVVTIHREGEDMVRVTDAVPPSEELSTFHTSATYRYPKVDPPTNNVLAAYVLMVAG